MLNDDLHIDIRLKELDERIRTKFSENWQLVRKAFLDNDLDHDGYLTIDEFMAMFDRKNEVIDCNDLKKLFQFKSKNNKLGRMSY